MSGRTCAGAAGAVTLAALALAGSGVAAIVPQKSIRGVRIGETVRAVHADLGAPTAVHYGTNEMIGRVRSERYGLTTVRYDGTGLAAKVLQVDTRSAKERVNGVGVGSTRAEVAKHVPKVVCSASEGCQVGRSVAGARVTAFSFDARGLVSQVTVGVVVD
jgi:hypothetical protein